MRIRVIAILLLASLICGALCACSGSGAASVDNVDKLVSVSGRRFIDKENREVLLHGFNLIETNKDAGFIGAWDDEYLKSLGDLGINTVRLSIFWSRIEPTPGHYDDDYFMEIKEVTDRCANAGLYVILDMHQEMFGEAFGRGAPEWASISGGASHTAGTLQYDGYFQSAAVFMSFDSFWANMAVESDPKGLGVMQRYATMLRRVSREFADVENVIGYELMNDPIPGSSIQAGFNTLIDKVEFFIENDFPAMYRRYLSDATGMLSDGLDRASFINLLEEFGQYQKIIGALDQNLQAFDRGVLSDFYQYCRDAIRQYDKTGIIFLNANYYTVLGVKSGLYAVDDPETGMRDPNQAYSAHYYDPVGMLQYSMEPEGRNDFIIGNHISAAERMDIPLFISEWGGFSDLLPEYGYPLTTRSYMENGAISGAVKTTTENFTSENFLSIMARAYPSAVPGSITTYSYDHESGLFSCEWERDDEVNAAALFFYPKEITVSNVSVSSGSAAITPYGSGVLVEVTGMGSGAQTVEIS